MRDAPPDPKWPDDDMLTAAWGLIANASGGDWTKESPDWQQAAAKWRDAYGRAAAPAPPLTVERLAALLQECPYLLADADISRRKEWYGRAADWLAERIVPGLSRLEAPQ